MRIALKLAYIGTEFFGYQIQPGVPTVEGKILKALKELGVVKNPSKARYSAAGRTDRGVHALGQVIVFDTENPELAMPRVVNSKLDSIWAWAWAEVSQDFNARKSALSREYRYIFWGEGLDFLKMREASRIFLGTRDFTNFATIEKGKTGMCNVEKVSLQEKGPWIYLDIKANRFLWHMVRKIAMVLELIGKGERDEAWLRSMLETPRLNEGLEPLDAHGLILKNVEYPNILWNIDYYARRRAFEEIQERYLWHGTMARILKEIKEGF